VDVHHVDLFAARDLGDPDDGARRQPASHRQLDERDIRLIQLRGQPAAVRADGRNVMAAQTETLREQQQLLLRPRGSTAGDDLKNVHEARGAVRRPSARTGDLSYYTAGAGLSTRNARLADS